MIGIVELHSGSIQALQTSAQKKLMGNGGRNVVVKSCKRETFLVAILPIMAVDAQVVQKCVHGLFLESICLQVVGIGKTQVYVDVWVQFSEEV